jgi:hypothetical protein
MTNDSSPVSVVMGDLVRSEGQRPADEVYRIFNDAVDATNQRHADRLASPLTITLGDEFQGITLRLTDAVPVVRDLRLALIRQGLDCRFVVGQVALMSPLNPQRAWNMMGPGLSRARAKLNEKLSTTLYRFAFLNDPLAETLADALGAGLTLIERGWTARQRDLIEQMDAGQSATDLAAAEGVSVKSIYKVRAAGQHEAYSLLWAAILALLTSIDARKESG